MSAPAAALCLSSKNRWPAGIWPDDVLLALCGHPITDGYTSLDQAIVILKALEHHGVTNIEWKLTRPASSTKARQGATKTAYQPKRASPAAAEKPKRQAKLYYIDEVEGDQAGPVTPDDLPWMFSKGVLNEYTMMWTKGMPDWLPLTTVVLEGTVDGRSIDFDFASVDLTEDGGV